MKIESSKDIDNIKRRILRTLVNKQMWNGKHTEHIVNCLPRHIRGEKIVKQAIDELVKCGWLLPAKKTKETHYSLDAHFKKEIAAFLQLSKKRI